jgi:hypothetical protein
MKKHLRAVAITLGVVLGLLPVAPVFAATAPTANNNSAGQALEISPPVLTLNADPGQVIKTQISLRDVSTSALIVKGQANDFIAAGEDGTPKILLDSNETSPFSLKDWVAPLPQLLMKPREIRNLPVTFTVPANASPGGHYGVIRFTATPPDLSSSGVSLSASLGSLVLITVSGKTTSNLSVATFGPQKSGKAKSLFESTPITFVTRLRNSGNVQEQPVGRIIIKDMFGKTVAGLNVNLPPRFVLPDSIRRFESPLDATVIGNKHLFGHYKASLTVNYGPEGKSVVTSSVSFWVIPYRLIGAIIVILIVGFFALRYFIRGYNKRIITRAQNNRRR